MPELFDPSGEQGTGAAQVAPDSLPATLPPADIANITAAVMAALAAAPPRVIVLSLTPSLTNPLILTQG